MLNFILTAAIFHIYTSLTASAAAIFGEIIYLTRIQPYRKTRKNGLPRRLAETRWQAAEWRREGSKQMAEVKKIK